ncbi:MAG: hypothetical protein ACLTMH_09740 [Faecalimonas umbilicata]|uniref:hypothetical protein n=1 Tax=Faecalimonas umbilicata TaxID=1912855 RepID=UPI003992844C
MGTILVQESQITGSVNLGVGALSVAWQAFSLFLKVTKQKKRGRKSRRTFSAA